MGAIVMPPVPAFYHRPQGIDDIINNTINRILDLLDLPNPNKQEWQGL
jgi:4-hydroxy-3-polyprenylbenzoate decarboxylase